MHRISVITATLNRPSLRDACASVDAQTFRDWHHYVLGDGIAPVDYRHPNRTTLGFSKAIGADEPTADMPLGTPNPIYRWALEHLVLGEFVCFLDDDNAQKPEFLRRMVEALSSSSRAGIALCALEDRRFSQPSASSEKVLPKSLYRIDEDPEPALWDGFPECGRCDNSAFLTYSDLAKAEGFPRATSDCDAVQDFELIRALATKHGWIRVPDKLILYGIGPNTPPPGR